MGTSMAVQCPNCRTDNPADSKYCKECATPLPPTEVSVTKTLETSEKELITEATLSGRYRIIKELGKGGMGKVYKAVDTEINEEIALKLLKPEIVAEDKVIERFRNELKIARKISHKNVCRMYHLEKDENTTFITMEYVEGEDLKSSIEQKGKIPLNEAIIVAKQIAEGLAEAHRLGVVHRDLKPQNIMIDCDGNAHIMDFGIARIMASPGMTKEGTIIGTPDYMSPEQVDGKEADQRADLYSLGVIIYEMVTGRVPFKGESAMSVALKHKTESPPNPRELDAQIPESLDRLILKCMEKDKEQRFQSAASVLSELVTIEMEIKGEPAAPTEKISDISLPDGPESKNSIAVLPFKDMSPQKDQDYFCEGVAEELINALTQVKDLKVAARTSSFSFKGKDVDIREMGRILNVGTVLEGSVQKSGNHLRITAQLINVSDGYHIWSERFDRTMDNIFAIQDEISIAIVDKLKGELLEEDKEKITKRHTVNKDALNLYLKGRYFFNRRYQGDMIKAVDFYQRAIDKDPNYALPYVGISDVFNIMGQWAFIHPKEAHTRSKTMLQKAIEIDNSLSEAYSSLAFMTMGYEWDFPAARNYLLRSIDLNPQNAIAHAWYAQMLAIVGRNEEAVIEAKTAIECDPLFPVIQSILGVVLAVKGQVNEGREQVEKAISMNPDQPMPYLFQGMIYLMKPSSPEKAIEYLKKSVEFGMTIAYGWLGAAYALVGRKEEALNILEDLDRIEKERYISPMKKFGIYLKPGLKHFRFMKRKYVTPLTKCVVYLALNMQGEALDWLEKAGQERDYFFPATLMLMNRFDFTWDKEIKAHPRFKALQRKIKSG
jgi:serine/threonine protein kinase/tetratricopeptide (TPR) repeat protein